jgi:nicotinamide-nucleotide amidase
VVAVGDELLYGQTMNTNGSWLSGELSRIGLKVRHRAVVGDVEGDIQAAVASAMEGSEVVLVTGGLGPTPDDLTREAVASCLEVALVEDAALVEGLTARFKARGYETLPDQGRRMAMVPLGGEVLPNPHGAAPGLAMEGKNGRICILLPGVPREMRGIFTRGVEPLLKERFPDRLQEILHRIVNTHGVPESMLMDEIRTVLPEDPRQVSLAYLPDEVGVRLRLSTRQEDGLESASRRLDRLEQMLEPVLSRYRYEARSGDLAEAVGSALLRAGKTLAVAESCTGGLIGKRMTDLPGSSRYFLGGVVAYANEVKTGLLGLEGGLLAEDGVVSREVASAMAERAAILLRASAGIGITGIAGPSGGSREKPVGTVWYAVHLDDRTVARKELFPGDRTAIRARAAHGALGLLLRLLEGREG